MMLDAVEQIVSSSSSMYLYLLICTALLVIGFPAWMISLLSGFLYGTTLGFGVVVLLTGLSTVLSWLLGFVFVWLACFLVRFWKIKFVLPDRIMQKVELLRENGNLFLLVLLLKINPVVPFAFVPFLWGCMIKKSPIVLLIGSVAGAIPLGMLWCIQGASLKGVIEASSLVDMASGRFGGIYYYVFIIVASAAIIVFINKKFRQITEN